MNTSIYRNKKSRTSIALLTAGMLLFSACSDSETATEDADDTEMSEGTLSTTELGQQFSTEVSIDGDPLTPYSPAIPEDPEVGKTFPTLTGESFDGTPITIEADGKPKAIYFLAHWCSHCQAEVPIVQELIDSGEAPENLEIYSISTLVNQAPSNYPPQEWLEGENWTPPVLLDDEQSTLFRMLGGTGTPYIVYLDGNNTITNRVSRVSTGEETLVDWQEAASVEN